jgi:hypothetical protein
MSEVSGSIEKVAEAIGKKSKKSIFDWFTAVAPFVVTIVSIVITFYLAKTDRMDKIESARKDSIQKAESGRIAQMDAVSKVLSFLSDEDSRKNTLGLITLHNFGQDTLVEKFLRSGLFKAITLEKTSILIAKESKDTTIQRQAKIYFQPGQLALQNAITELSKGARSMTGRNDGEFVKKYNSFCGVAEGQPWAATFVSWCYNVNFKYFKPEGNTNKLEQYFTGINATFAFAAALPEPGDIYFYNWNGNRAIGIVDKYLANKDSMYAIEGNSNDIPGPAYKVARVGFSKEELVKDKVVFARVEQK